ELNDALFLIRPARLPPSASSGRDHRWRTSHALLKKVSEMGKASPICKNDERGPHQPDNRYFIPECLSPEYATEIRFLFGNIALRLLAQPSIGFAQPTRTFMTISSLEWTRSRPKEYVQCYVRP